MSHNVSVNLETVFRAAQKFIVQSKTSPEIPPGIVAHLGREISIVTTSSRESIQV